MSSSSPAPVPVCAQHPGDDVSLAESIERVARTDAGLTFVDDQLRPSRVPYRDLAVRAVRVARHLRGMGVAPGDRVCLLSRTTPAMLAVLFGVWRLGAAPVVLPRPRRSSASDQAEEVRRRVVASGATLLLTEADDAAAHAAPAGVPALDVADVAAADGVGPTPPVPGPEVLGLLQFTSGTTAVSRAVPVSQGQLVGNIARLATHLGIGPGDRYVTWLPLYHDMGLLTLGGLTAAGLDLVIMATETFIGDPSAWFRTIHEHHGTVTFAPDFAYTLAAQALRRGRSSVNLKSLRVAVNGAEAIDAEALGQSLGVFTRHGMRPEAMCPAYGLAEATLAVTATSPGAAVRTVEAEPGLGSHPAPDRRLVSCGAPVADTEVSIRDATGTVLPPGRVGEVLVRGPGTMAGYWDTTSELEGGSGVLADGWLPTGDLGFLDGGELALCGRLKDLIIVGGRNLYPEDYEIVAERVPGIRSGNVAAFSLPDAERMVVVAEARGNGSVLGRTADELFTSLRTSLDCAPHEVVLIRPGTLPKTSSGKRRRGRSRQQYLEGSLDVVHRTG